MSATVVSPRVGRDPEYLAFVRRVAQARADTEALGIEEEREGFARNTARLPRAPMAEVRDLTVPGGDGPLRARVLVPPQASDDALVYVHGGGWFLGDLDGWEPVARVIAEATRCRILEIEHRQAPEHPFPAALHDVLAALRWAVDHADAIGARRVGAVGDSWAATSSRRPRVTSTASRSRHSSTPRSISRAIPRTSRTPTGSPSPARWRRRASATSAPPTRAIPTCRRCEPTTSPAFLRP
jgi:hypothetical protein